MRPQNIFSILMLAVLVIDYLCSKLWIPESVAVTKIIISLTQFVKKVVMQQILLWIRIRVRRILLWHNLHKTLVCLYMYPNIFIDILRGWKANWPGHVPTRNSRHNEGRSILSNGDKYRLLKKLRSKPNNILTCNNLCDLLPYTYFLKWYVFELMRLIAWRLFYPSTVFDVISTKSCLISVKHTISVRIDKSTVCCITKKKYFICHILLMLTYISWPRIKCPVAWYKKPL